MKYVVGYMIGEQSFHRECELGRLEALLEHLFDVEAYNVTIERVRR